MFLAASVKVNSGIYYMYKMNKDLPYEQQVKNLLHHYDQLVEENEALKARIKEMEDERAEYGNPKELREMLKTLPSAYLPASHAALPPDSRNSFPAA